ncbi:MAG: GH3 auxin-responsive promoter family protein [Deltaproteobacteria bacterium]|nr:GH3 auxin-responsive promoter family protein [Deltaproteobacteria bacterium]
MMTFGRRIASRFMRLRIGMKGAAMLKRLNAESKDVKRAQANVLNDILSYAGDTIYGLEHGFSTVRSPAEFKDSVPVNTYEDLRPYVRRHEEGESNVLFPGKPMFYATTSGTTDAPKRIPITRKYHDECYNGLSNIWLHSMFQESPGFMNGYDISMVGKAIEGYTADGTSYGSFSGHMNAYMPEFIKRFRVIPFEIHDIDDYPSRYYALLRVGLTYPIRWIVAANPSTLLELHRASMMNIESIIKDIHDGTLKEHLNISAPIRARIEARLKPCPKRAKTLERLLDQWGNALRPRHYWPSLQMINTWKSGNAGVYLEQTADFYSPQTVIREFGYLATEARAGIVLNKNQETSILACHLLYFEFVDRDDLDNTHPTYLCAHELEKGREYAIYITTPSGLYRYNINDIVRVEDFHGTFPMVRFVQKGSGVTSMTGEKLYESQYLIAVNKSMHDLNIQPGFHLAFADIERSVYHCFVELEQRSIEQDKIIARLSADIDDTLQQMNPEYAAKRKSNRLGPLQVHSLQPNAFAAYKTEKLKQGHREGQFKMTHLQQDPSQMRLFFDLCNNESKSTGGNL